MRVLSQKNYRWLYEREWRMFGPQGLVSYGGLSCVKSVYIGFCAPIELRKKIEGRLSKLNIKVKTIKIEKYSISF
jgi:predicted ferric reductase